MNTTSFRYYRVLVAEDDAQGSRLIALVLKNLGFEDVQMTQNGADAWELFNNATEPYHLIISDWNMLHLSGLELLQRIRKTNPHIPFIMITGRGKLESAVDAKTFGVTHFMHKPYSPHRLIQKIKTIFEHEFRL